MKFVLTEGKLGESYKDNDMGDKGRRDKGKKEKKKKPLLSAEEKRKAKAKAKAGDKSA